MKQNGRARPVRIVFCENNVDGTIGGSYFSLLYLVKGLDRHRFAPIVVFSANHSLLPVFQEAGIETIVWPRIRPLTFGANMHGAFRWLKPPMVALQKALNLFRGFLLPSMARAWFLIRRRVTIVHLNNSVLFNHDWMLGARLAGRKCITHERGINPRYSRAAKFFGKRLDAIICISDAVRRNMQERGADFGNLVTIPNGLDPEVVRIHTAPHVLRANYGLDAGAIVVGMIGNIKAWKGQDTLVRAMERVCREYPSARCVLVGDTSPLDRDYERTVQELVSSLGLQKQVIFTGFQSNVPDFLMMFDVVVHASVLPEPFGRVILEAMACRKPVIGARGGAVPEIIQEGITGLTFPPGDADALADAILRLIASREEARRLGEKGYERLVREFHIARNIEATERTYETLLSATS